MNSRLLVASNGRIGLELNMLPRVARQTQANSRIIQREFHSCRTTGTQKKRYVYSASRRQHDSRIQPSSMLRALSTNSSSEAAKPPIDTPPPAPNTIQTNKSKPKIELRPGPAKVTPTTATTSSPKSPSTSSQTQAIKLQPTKPPPSEGSEALNVKEEDAKTEKENLIEMTKYDIEDAAKHGILAPPPEGAGMVRKAIHQIKELFKFYIAGLKLIVSNAKLARAIQERAKSGGKSISWKERRFIETNRSDVAKLVPFIATILVIEEIIPLIVLYAPGFLPSTCILPSQRERINKKRHEKQRSAYVEASSRNLYASIDAKSIALDTLNSEVVNNVCTTLGLSALGVYGMQRRRILKKFKNIVEEDSLLVAEGKGARLSSIDVADFLWERGFLADKFTPLEQRRQLAGWLEQTSKDTTSVSAEDVRLRMLVQTHKEMKHKWGHTSSSS